MSSCRVRVNRHGYLGFRLRWHGFESYEGTTLTDTPENRAKVEARAAVIEQEIQAGTFEYLRWFPNGNRAAVFHRAQQSGRRMTLDAFFASWGGEKAKAKSKKKAERPVTPKWAANRASLIRTHVLPRLGHLSCDELTGSRLLHLQREMRDEKLADSTIDKIVHNALRAMLRDARVAGVMVPDV